MARPLVSAVIPAFNSQEFVSDAINSVLSQTLSAVECLLIDDGSTDDTASVASAIGDQVVVIRTENRGVAAARNLGIAESRAPLVAFLDADDCWLPHKLEAQLAERGDADFVYAAVKRVDRHLKGDEIMAAPAIKDALRNTLLLSPPVIHLSQTGLIDKQVFKRVKTFDERLSTAADFDLACRLAASVSMAACHEPLALYRQHESQMHTRDDQMEADVLRSLDALFSDKDQLPTEIRDLRSAAEARLHFTLALHRAKKGLWSRALTQGIKGLAADPLETIRLIRRRLWG